MVIQKPLEAASRIPRATSWARISVIQSRQKAQVHVGGGTWGQMTATTDPTWNGCGRVHKPTASPRGKPMPDREHGGRRYSGITSRGLIVGGPPSTPVASSSLFEWACTYRIANFSVGGLHIRSLSADSGYTSHEPLWRRVAPRMRWLRPWGRMLIPMAGGPPIR